MPGSEKSKRRRTFIYLWVLIALSVLFVAATYTWFYISRTPHVSDMALHVNVHGGLEIGLKPDGGDDEWGGYCDYSDLVGGDDCPLRPVTWSASAGRFLTVTYGFDGRLHGYAELSDERNANRKDGEGYYIKGTFYLRTDSDCSVVLSEAVSFDGGQSGSGTYVIGLPEWDENAMKHADAGDGAERAVRIGFMLTPLARSGLNEKGEREFYIYEPNCAADDWKGFTETLSADGGHPLQPGRMIYQAYSAWEEADPVLRGTTVKTLGRFLTNRPLFRLDSETVLKVEMYIWLEGRDPDCFSRFTDAKLIANIQLDADYSGQSGLEDIKG
ncbi:MAG: hypothetical protein IJU75_01690 [Clostridia bacterium]|nr:hypothetical protein [Clostridia bacterium]